MRRTSIATGLNDEMRAELTLKFFDIRWTDALSSTRTKERASLTTVPKMSLFDLQHYGQSLGPCLASVLISGCLIAPPQELERPEQIPPRTFNDQADPPLTSPVAVSSSSGTRTFQVPFVSEDLGETVVGKLYLNYGGLGEAILVGSAEKTGATIDTMDREMIVAWQSREPAPGCYAVTMAITHESNYTNDFPPLPVDDEATAFVTWWVAYDIELTDVTLYECDSQGDPTSLSDP